jgi:hypothetical protein
MSALRLGTNRILPQWQTRAGPVRRLSGAVGDAIGEIMNDKTLHALKRAHNLASQGVLDHEAWPEMFPLRMGYRQSMQRTFQGIDGVYRNSRESSVPEFGDWWKNGAWSPFVKE